MKRRAGGAIDVFYPADPECFIVGPHIPQPTPTTSRQPLLTSRKRLRPLHPYRPLIPPPSPWQANGRARNRTKPPQHEPLRRVPPRDDMASESAPAAATDPPSGGGGDSSGAAAKPSYSLDPALYIYTSLTAGSSHIVTATSRLETILRANRVPFKALDVATDDKARMLWGRRAGKDDSGRLRKLPGLVQMGLILGVNPPPSLPPSPPYPIQVLQQR